MRLTRLLLWQSSMGTAVIRCGQSSAYVSRCLMHACSGLLSEITGADFPDVCSGNAKMEPGAVVCRASESFVRFGTFQLPSSRGGDETALVRQLADYVIKHNYPHLEGELPDTLHCSSLCSNACPNQQCRCRQLQA